MPSSGTMRPWALLLLAAAISVWDGAAAPAAAQHVEVFVNGRRVANVVLNGNGALNGGGTLFNGNGTLFNGSDGTFFDGNRTVFDGSDGLFFNGNGRRFLNGNGRVFNGNRRVFFNGNGRVFNGNGRRFVNGANGGVFINGANGFNGNGWRQGWHNKRHFGPVDECFPDASIGEWRCTGRRWRTHSGPHRGAFRGARTNGLLF
jgi:hypothetical protein